MTSPDNPYGKKPANSSEGVDSNEPALLSVPMSTDPEADAALQAAEETDAGWTVVAEEKNKLAAWALGLGIASVVLLLTIVLPLLVGLVGIVLGIMAVRSAKKNTTQGRRMGMSVAGLVLSAVSFVLSIAMTIALVAFMAPIANDVTDCANQHPEGSSELDQCVQEVLETAFAA